MPQPASQPASQRHTAGSIKSITQRPERREERGERREERGESREERAESREQRAESGREAGRSGSIARTIIASE
jgi:hypothetical protein